MGQRNYYSNIICSYTKTKEKTNGSLNFIEGGEVIRISDFLIDTLCSYCPHTSVGVASTSGGVTATVTALWNWPLDTSLTVVTPHMIVSTTLSVTNINR